MDHDMHMENEQIIPTRLKSKIPQKLSYPIGAKAISDALLGVPQFNELTLDFWFWNRLARHHGTETPYRVMEVQYSGPMRFHSASASMEEKGYYRPRWKITVLAVPRHLRHIIHDKIVAEALPLIRTWLFANPHSTEREGGHGLVFTFDELKVELTKDEHASIEWQTPRVGRPG